jgi:hypothetical protein
LAIPKPAVEWHGYLDAEHDRELAGVDDLARFERIFDDAEPALARPPALRVDVTLQLADALSL